MRIAPCLLFSLRRGICVSKRASDDTLLGYVLTDIENIASAARVQVQGRIACWAILRLELSYKLVETCLVRNVRARELQNPLAAKRVLQRLLANGAFTPYKGPLPPRTIPVRDHTRHIVLAYGIIGCGRADGSSRAMRRRSLRQVLWRVL